jgi:hypothetical protein
MIIQVSMLWVMTICSIFVTGKKPIIGKFLSVEELGNLCEHYVKYAVSHPRRVQSASWVVPRYLYS